MLSALDILAFETGWIIVLIVDANNSFGFCGFYSSGNQIACFGDPVNMLTVSYLKTAAIVPVSQISYSISVKSKYRIL